MEKFDFKSQYLRMANAARHTAIDIPDEVLREDLALRRQDALRMVAEKLRGSIFHKTTVKSKIPLPDRTVEQYLLARLYLKAFQQISRARQDKVEIALLLAPSERLVAFEHGKIIVGATSMSQLYAEFLAHLKFFDPNRIKLCPECGAVFEGRKNSIFCSNKCRQAHWRMRNPEEYQQIQRDSDWKKKQLRQQYRLSRELRQVNARGIAR